MIANGTWYVIQNPGEAWTVVKKGLNTEYLFFFVNFQGNFSEVNLIATNGFDRPLKYAGGVVTELANAPDWANFVCTHDNRLYMSKESTIYFSALRKAEDWSTVNDSGQIVVETTDGLDIRGLVAGSAHLTVFKLNSMWELYGTNPSNYELKMVSDNLGSPTGNSAQVIDGVIYFLGNDGVYRYAGGSMPSDDFSIPVRNIVRSINQDYSYRAVSWQSEKKYYLSFPSGSSTKCDTILEFDTERNVWNTWVTQYAVTARGVNLDGMTYAGCSGGYVYRFDGAGNGGQIVFDWVSKPYTMGSMAAKARWFKMWVVADIPSGATLNIHLSTEQEGDDSWTLVQSVTPNTNIQSKEIPIPILLTNQSNWVRVRLEGTGQVVVHELTRQLRIFPFGQG